MNHYQIPIFWDAFSVQETKDILSSGLSRFPGRLRDIITFEVVSKAPPLGTLKLEAGVVVAIISSSVAVAASVLSCIAQIASARAGKANAMMEISLGDGSTLKIPVGATTEDVERLLTAARSLRDIKEIKLTSLKKRQ
jgi:hypothetical protein